MTNNTKLVTQLRTLLQLTHAEAQIADVRVAQARTEAVRRELEQNAGNARERAQMLTDTLRELGGTPAIVGPVLGRAAALLKTALEQAEPLDEALLQDLALEHQLLDRARYLKVLADRAEQAQVRKLAERLITAHNATVQWLTVVLAEEALGGPVALRATPLQRAAGGAGLVLRLPARYTLAQVDRAVDNVARSGEQAKQRLSSAADKAGQLASATRSVVSAGRNASLRRTESLARESGDIEAAEAAHSARRETGLLDAEELPVEAYDSLNVQDAIKAVRDLREVDDVRAVLRYEENNADRSRVISAAQTHIASLAKEAAGIS